MIATEWVWPQIKPQRVFSCWTVLLTKSTKLTWKIWIPNCSWDSFSSSSQPLRLDWDAYDFDFDLSAKLNPLNETEPKKQPNLTTKPEPRPEPTTEPNEEQGKCWIQFNFQIFKIADFTFIGVHEYFDRLISKCYAFKCYWCRILYGSQIHCLNVQNIYDIKMNRNFTKPQQKEFISFSVISNTRKYQMDTHAYRRIGIKLNIQLFEISFPNEIRISVWIVHIRWNTEHCIVTLTLIE